MKKLILTLLIVLCITLPSYAHRMAAGTTDQYIYFVAVDSTDLKTRETGFSSFTVYYSINGGAAAADGSVTVNETDNTNMPGVYEYLVDVGAMTTLTAGDDTHELCLHITHAGMDPVTRVIEIYRPETTLGQTLTVASGVGEADAVLIDGNDVTADNLHEFFGKTSSVGAYETFEDAYDDTGISTGDMFSDVTSRANNISDMETALGNTGLVLTNTTIAAYTSNTSFTLTAGPAHDTAVVGATCIIIDQSDTTQVAVGRISAYTTAANTVTLESDPLAAFTFANGDTVLILPNGRGIDTAAILTDTSAQDTAGEWDTLNATVVTAVGTTLDTIVDSILNLVRSLR